jgi:hypothetical protein
VIGPFGAPGNFVVVQVGAREEQGHLSLEEVLDTVRAAVFRPKFAEYLDDLLEKLRGRAEIEVNTDLLASMQISGEQVEESGDAPPAAHGH